MALTSEHHRARRAADYRHLAPAPAQSEPARSAATKRVTWAELFFDVVYVFVITQVTEMLRAHHDPKGLLQALVVFVPVYWAWVGVSVYADTHNVDALVDRLGLFVVGVASLFMAIAMPGAYGSRGVLLGASYFAARVTLALLALRGPFRNVPRNPYNVACSSPARWCSRAASSTGRSGSRSGSRPERSTY